MLDSKGLGEGLNTAPILSDRPEIERLHVITSFKYRRPGNFLAKHLAIKFLVHLIFVVIVGFDRNKVRRIKQVTESSSIQSHCSYKPTQLKCHVHVARVKNYSLLLFVVNTVCCQLNFVLLLNFGADAW